MGKLDVILKKEEVEANELKNDIVVVFDVFLATSTIAVVLDHGAREVIAVKNEEEAMRIAEELDKDTFIIAGELDGEVINTFEKPWPLSLKKVIKGKTLILTTSNGTVAIDKSSKSKHLYASAIINNESVAKYVAEHHSYNENITLICAGSDGKFSLEDFLGAGSFISFYMERQKNSIELTDSALAALLCFEGKKDELEKVLAQSMVGKQLVNMGIGMELGCASAKNSYRIIPVKKGNGFIGIRN